MAFIDELTIHGRGGRGGDGVVRWLNLKAAEFSGPAGGNGGKGGAVYIRGVRDIAILARYTGTKEFRAGDGGAGQGRSRHGADGKDVVVDLPVGSLVRNLETGETFELLEDGQQIMILSGGRGGVGNEHFKSSVNRTPEQSTKGQEGQSADFHIELRLVADAGFVGLPNAGKSSLLNSLTNAKAQVGAYAFTTLDPNLGALFGFVLADIPGLIEGASKGKGLGHKFLRHITRTRMILHCVSLEEEDPVAVYTTVRNELASYDESLAEKRELIILTKTDMVDAQTLSNITTLFETMGKEVTSVSILDDASVKALLDRIVSILRAL